MRIIAGNTGGLLTKTSDDAPVHESYVETSRN